MTILDALKKILPSEHISDNDTVLEQHSSDESYHTPKLPDVVVFPQTTEEVSQIMKVACEYKTPVVSYGLGTSLEGSVIPYEKGIVIDYTLMNKVLEVRPDDFLVKVQPGVTRKQLERELKKYGLFFSVDPGADATLGGMAATNASGTTSVKYGIMRDQVRDLEVVLADGTIIHTGSMAAKSSSGYHLNGLFVGSEGTLGCFTELTLKVHGIPEQIMAGRAAFQTLDEAVAAVISILQAGIPIARVELVDDQSMKQINLFSDTTYREVPTVFLEFHGNEAGLKQDVAFTKDLLEDHRCQVLAFESNTAARNRLWEARHNTAYAFLHSYPGKKQMVTDVCVPISELAGAIKDGRKAVEASGLTGGIVGHVGDGNYHILLMVDADDPTDIEKANQVNRQIVEYALKRGGTCTGEHGVGIGKAKYQEAEHGNALEIMRKVKSVLDPNNLLNPGKVLYD
ncbi:MAG: FAD-binding oxidoreductase [Bacillota bacterium]|uniref:D-lactate dehydrogenase (cytochrome) n=1 Tax=Virgibacillus salarius TaxID=447199 RepID=A0A941DPM7_9BACI|nr:MULTISPECIES: FAD-linked oxidase C-terminal domain-containing protein [Bacillaceae]NAZ07326.1 FAD-binding protein [Agaribacter marinus]MBR7794604.1 FAD-binding protein [Virgibacillus salarius]MCC2252176.1 FAD-binding protein [Virgibacillus sp. AGTR]MDY7045505.1 FAD-linked oxidase C-terminal domain-containing protein [Virgibacillus sp. M23]QRZ16346.1 FAD-binding protein [Virgibacillus sp. AGTR]